MIEVKQVSFAYPYQKEENNLLQELSFTIPDGQIVGVLGANGVGKTTLLKLLAGLLQPQKGGSILYDGKPILEIQGELAFITEEGSYFKDLTPLQFGAFLADFYPQFDSAYYQKILTFFQLEEKPIKQMSKGQKAKVEVAAGMAKRAKYMIMDEPFIGKDMFTRQDFMQALASSLTGTETVLITTHEIEEIEHFIDRALILKEAHIVADVLLDDLREQGKRLPVFLKEVSDYNEDAFQALLETE